MMEKHLAKKKWNLDFVDLEKALNRIPREVIRWVMRKSGVDEWLVQAVMTFHSGATAVVTALCW